MVATTAFIVNLQSVREWSGIETKRNKIILQVSKEEIKKRRKKWKQPDLKATNGILYKYAHQVKPASEGCVTDE